MKIKAIASLLAVCIGSAAALPPAPALTGTYARLAAEATQRWHPQRLQRIARSIAGVDELFARIHNPADPLDNPQRYAPLLALPGIPRQLYDHAELLLRAGQHTRAEPLFALLASPANPDGFCAGNSFYWLGLIAEYLRRDSDTAFAHYVKVHSYPACLVYIDAAYRRTAVICHTRGLADTALALYAIRIPSIDYCRNEILKAQASFELAHAMHDITNLVRQCLRAAEVATLAPEFRPHAERLRQELSLCVSSTAFAAIAHYLDTFEPYDLYTMQAIRRALTGPDAATNHPPLMDMLLHDWPSLDDVAAAYPEILTNRPASNNVFEQRRHPWP